MAIQNDNTLVTKGDLKNLYSNKILPYLGGNFALATNVSDYYSTDEKLVGLWINGKPLYQKTYGPFLTTPYTTDGRNWVDLTDLTSLNIDTMVNISGTVLINEGTRRSLPFIDQGKYECAVVYMENVAAASDPKHLKTLITNTNSGASYSDLWATITYTKTTDSAGSAAATPGCYDLNRPDLWPTNQEIFFGNGLYGYRASGIANVTANVRWDLVIARNQPNAKIRSQGGGFTTTSNWFCPTPWHYENSDGTVQCATSMFIGVIEGTKNVNYYIMSSGQGALPYDVWVTYTK